MQKENRFFFSFSNGSNFPEGENDKTISNPLAPLCLVCVFAFTNPAAVVFIRLEPLR
jgi:hypothetical protein